MLSHDLLFRFNCIYENKLDLSTIVTNQTHFFIHGAFKLVFITSTLRIN